MVYYSWYFFLEDCFCIKLRSFLGCDIMKVCDSLLEDLNLWFIDEVEIEFYECLFFFVLLNWFFSLFIDFDNDLMGML